MKFALDASRATHKGTKIIHYVHGFNSNFSGAEVTLYQSQTASALHNGQRGKSFVDWYLFCLPFETEISVYPKINRTLLLPAPAISPAVSRGVGQPAAAGRCAGGETLRALRDGTSQLPLTFPTACSKAQPARNVFKGYFYFLSR